METFHLDFSTFYAVFDESNYASGKPSVNDVDPTHDAKEITSVNKTTLNNETTASAYVEKSVSFVRMSVSQREGVLISVDCVRCLYINLKIMELTV